MARTKTGKSPEFSAAKTRDELERLRGGVWAVGPSGVTYKVRQLNTTRHALTGNLPARLRQLATTSRNSAQMAAAVVGAEENGDMEGSRAILEYMDSCVLKVFVEPEFTQSDLGDGSFDDEPLIPASDYTWAFNIAQGEETRDGQGRLLWGREPLSRWDGFREVHGCGDDCEHCDELRTRWSAALSSGW